MFPPVYSQIFLQIERPTPFPRMLLDANLLKGVKISPIFSGGIPIPSSSTETFIRISSIA